MGERGGWVRGDRQMFPGCVSSARPAPAAQLRRGTLRPSWHQPQPLKREPGGCPVVRGGRAQPAPVAVPGLSLGTRPCHRHQPLHAWAGRSARPVGTRKAGRASPRTPAPGALPAPPPHCTGLLRPGRRQGGRPGLPLPPHQLSGPAAPGLPRAPPLDLLSGTRVVTAPLQQTGGGGSRRGVLGRQERCSSHRFRGVRLVGLGTAPLCEYSPAKAVTASPGGKTYLAAGASRTRVRSELGRLGRGEAAGTRTARPLYEDTFFLCQNAPLGRGGCVVQVLQRGQQGVGRGAALQGLAAGGGRRWRLLSAWAGGHWGGPCRPS